MHWGGRTAPTLTKWIRDLVYCKEQMEAYAEELPLSSRSKDFWAPLITYLVEYLAMT